VSLSLARHSSPRCGVRLRIIEDALRLRDHDANGSGCNRIAHIAVAHGADIALLAASASAYANAAEGFCYPRLVVSSTRGLSPDTPVYMASRWPPARRSTASGRWLLLVGCRPCSRRLLNFCVLFLYFFRGTSAPTRQRKDRVSKKFILTEDPDAPAVKREAEEDWGQLGNAGGEQLICLALLREAH
jgi:hypothetical protein